MSKTTILLSMAALMVTSLEAASPAPGPHAAASTVVVLELVDENGRVLPTYPAPSESSDVQRAFVEAQRDTRYSIRARNLTGERVGIVVAVDGRNIISGERSELGRGESMYVLEPYQSTQYAGWRTSDSEIRRFYFTDIGDSYASRIGDESAVGVIAAAVYEARRERPQRWRGQTEGAPAAPSAAESRDGSEATAGRSAQAGTGFGEHADSRAVRVSFDPARRPSQRSFFKYEWSEQLCARGVKSCRSANRFWPESRLGFVPFPPGEAD